MLSAASSSSPPASHPLASRLVADSSHLNLAPASSAAAAAPPAVELARTASHEVFGYAPYWALAGSSSDPVSDFSTIAYFSVDVKADGTISKSGPGWEGYLSQDLENLITRAHKAGDRVVLTATDFSQSSLDTLTHTPGAGVTLGQNLLELVQTKHLDGVNLDLEGVGSADQPGLDRLVSQVSWVLRVADPYYQFTMAVYASSASDRNGFYDIPGLAPSVDAFFVMAYDVTQGAVGPAGAGSGGADAGYISAYTSVVPASKVILGVPLFGYDEPTTGPALGDAATGAAQPVTYAQAAASGPTYWNATTDTAWTSYQDGTQWHQVFFDNANSLALKVQLAANANLLGVGVWALGMQGSDTSVLSVLNGGSPALRLPPVGPTARPSSSPAGGSGSGSTTTSSPPGNGTFAQPKTSGHPHRSGSTTSTSAASTTTSALRAPTTSTRSQTSSTTTSTTTTTTTTTTSVPGVIGTGGTSS